MFFTVDVEMPKRSANAVWVTLPFVYSLRIRSTCLGQRVDHLHPSGRPSFNTLMPGGDLVAAKLKLQSAKHGDAKPDG
jgi:hypothetical protein